MTPEERDCLAKLDAALAALTAERDGYRKALEDVKALLDADFTDTAYERVEHALK